MSALITIPRALARAAAAALFLTLWSLLAVLARPFFSGARAQDWRRGYLGRSCRGLLWILGVELEVVGSRPSTPGFLVTNHMGYLDILVIAAATEAVFVSRADVEHWPLLGRLTRWSGTIYLERERRADLLPVVESMQEWLARGDQVVFFPEGTSGRGDALLPFRSSLFEAAVRATAPVRCAALHYRTESGDPPADLAVSWWGDSDFGPHLWGLLKLRRVHARLEFAAEELPCEDRKLVAARAREVIAAHFRPTGDGTRDAERPARQATGQVGQG